MEAYSDFAKVYDIFMDNTPYEKWCGFLLSLFRKEGIEDGLVLDMGCGTGILTEMLEQAGYDLIGIDNSMDMLQIAMEKQREKRRIPFYISFRTCENLNCTVRSGQW